jgi:preprotein translocase subunit Sss1
MTDEMKGIGLCWGLALLVGMIGFIVGIIE